MSDVTSMKPPTKHVKSVFLAWIAVIAIDFLLNAGIFASVFVSVDDSFLLSPEQAFVRIPAGYASLLISTLVLTMLIHRGGEERPVDGLRTGLLFGAATSLGLVLALWSISTADSAFLAVWFIDFTLEMTAAGTIIVATRHRVSRRIASLVSVGAVLCFILGIVLQNLRV
ncbi:hypothetical protein A3K69_01595 [Candidatus Bathyarchaeota archaeon RBG_16_57_9]|nr:MAG: hypothetical protein A3K69_01595 [Candidatus Bathyarchaeota archaeon RBG_16_57_9]